MAVHAGGVADDHVAVTGVAAVVAAALATGRLTGGQRVARDGAVVRALHVAVVEVVAVHRTGVVAGGYTQVQRVAPNDAALSLALHVAHLESLTRTYLVVVAERPTVIVTAENQPEGEEGERAESSHAQGVATRASKSMKKTEASVIALGR